MGGGGWLLFHLDPTRPPHERPIVGKKKFTFCNLGKVYQEDSFIGRIFFTFLYKYNFVKNKC